MQNVLRNLYQIIRGIEVVILLCLFISCDNNKFNKVGGIEKRTEKENLTISGINKIILDSFLLDKFPFSSNGRFYFEENEIVVFDESFKAIHFFDHYGKLLRIWDGLIIDKENYEKINYPNSIIKFNSKYFYIWGRSITICNSDGKVKKNKNIDFEGSKSRGSFLELPDPGNMIFYELNLRNYSSYRLSPDEIIIPLESEHPLFNPYNSKFYFKNAYCFGKLNIMSNKLVGIPITHPGIYQNDSCLTTQDAAFITQIKDKFHVQFAADTLIYIYSSDYEHVGSYGNKGKFKPNYIYNNDLEIAFDIKKYFTNKNKSNTIENLFLLKDYNIVGRILHNRTEGKKYVQFYGGNKLLKEFELPNNFNFFGLSGNQIFGTIFNGNQTNTIRICKISLN